MVTIQAPAAPVTTTPPQPLTRRILLCTLAIVSFQVMLAVVVVPVVAAGFRSVKLPPVTGGVVVNCGAGKFPTLVLLQTTSMDGMSLAVFAKVSKLNTSPPVMVYPKSPEP